MQIGNLYAEQSDWRLKPIPYISARLSILGYRLGTLLNQMLAIDLEYSKVGWVLYRMLHLLENLDCANASLPVVGEEGGQSKHLHY